ncbi:MAG TPA: AMP-binding protein [Candidatus Acidoferrales bacterium]|nr:AMP-binding protein [Candidatus Acidoferrales bacterium]
MNFLEDIFAKLERAANAPVLQEARELGLAAVNGAELRALIESARVFLRNAGLAKGDRCAVLAHNSIRWAAADLALAAEGIVAVPLYARQAPRELAAMLRDAAPKLILAGDASLAEAIRAEWSDAPRCVTFEEIFASPAGTPEPPVSLADSDPVKIIYTSGTSGEAKGVVLTAGNVNFMLGCTKQRLDQLMRGHSGTERVFHYLPFCFAASWIALLTFLSRGSLPTLSMDLNRLQAEMQLAQPHYFLNVPTLLERVRRGIEENIAKRGGAIAKLFGSARTSWFEQEAGTLNRFGWMWLGIARAAIFPSIRKKIGANLKALICGSAPLSRDTQMFFGMLGIQVLQVYGLTETTAICTMDVPGKSEPGWVGSAIPGMEMKLAENQEIIVRGPNVFSGYWNRPQETAKVLRGGWFYTGDQGEVNANGNWRITGRIKNLIILNSGHNIAPEPIEEKLLKAIPGAQQAVLIGNGRSYLVAVVTGQVQTTEAQAAIDQVNGSLPHYKQVRAFHIEPNVLTVEGGLLTANGKLKRDAISAHFTAQLGMMYREKSA